KTNELAKLSIEAIKARTFETLQQILISRQERGPQVLIVEDLHWMDKASEELLDSLADVIVSARILLVLTCRPGQRPAWIGRSHVTQMPLGPLSTTESRRLLESGLRDNTVDEILITAILTRADGNPFFLE